MQKYRELEFKQDILITHQVLSSRIIHVIYFITSMERQCCSSVGQL